MSQKVYIVLSDTGKVLQTTIGQPSAWVLAEAKRPVWPSGEVREPYDGQYLGFWPDENGVRTCTRAYLSIQEVA